MHRASNIAVAAIGGAIPAWLAIVLAVGIFVMIVGGLFGLFNPQKLLPGFTQPQILAAYAHYFAIRNLTLAIALIVLYTLHATRTLGSLAAIVAVTQVFDAVVDFTQKSWMRRLFGVLVFVFAVFLFVAAAHFSGHPFWQRAAWVE